jgi:CubicO group peptidase (beta-lactamase class C family)
MSRSFACALALVVVFAQSSLAQPSKAKKIDDFLEPFIKANQFAGQIVAAENGKVIYDKAFGLANADFKIPNQPNTRIGIASITKLMTVVILNRLVEGGKMSMSDNLSKYIPDFPSGDKITIEMIARHRSGIPHRVMPPEAESVGYTSAEFIERVKQAKLAFEPGTRDLYSSGGYAVLARAMEIASGRSYSQLLDDFVFAPAGIKDSLHFNGEMVMERRAQDYYPSPDGMINVPLKDYSFLVGAGSVYGTARDVYKFGEAVIEGKYGESSKALIRNGIISGSGSTNGHRAYFEVAADKRYGYAIAANMSGAFDTISQGVKEILEGKELTAKYRPTPVVIPDPNKDLNEFLGRYRRTDGAEITIQFRNDHLYGADIKLYPVRPDCFFEYRFFGEACFDRTGGKITGISWKGVGFDFKYVKQ